MSTIRNLSLGFAWVCVISLTMSACGSDGDRDDQNDQGENTEAKFEMFFENSTRRDPSQVERDFTVNANRCAAFFVKNSKHKNLVVSARHCFNYAISSWCASGGFVNDNSGNRGMCRRIVAANSSRDIAMFEVDLPYDSSESRALTLASYAPRLNTRLTMVGYPVDRYRNGALTTTENCWIMQEDTQSPHGVGSALSDRSARHNCTTYGGNSGGPMISEGTTVALGLPFTYAPGDYTERSSNNVSTSSHMAKMADFVNLHRGVLEAEGVEIQDQQ